ncbi:hypothetical protein IAQ61_008867 [Plenodomus lingam]|uniref:Predicted protein n=1 Tax=Leptosphaeria maculans (strain JN3 / isolate v23.1.3 / race Av1-4-5-6-7-8) TaxID=985895 RepID=E4ZPB5_LEPMJ|nr:predicted protein [Plenodomus lingam JN3]KAH9864922.1 hypothetical protein IAQ61_008867 [Plenodomus lingam]CBX93140.1 predicted protein [Plenodomus lingam JN3]
MYFGRETSPSASATTAHIDAMSKKMSLASGGGGGGGGGGGVMAVTFASCLKRAHSLPRGRDLER